MTRSRNVLNALTVLACLATVFVFGAGTAHAFDEGVVSVSGYKWSIKQPRVDVQVNEIADSSSGKTTYTVLQIIQFANKKTAQFDWATIARIEMFLPGSNKLVGCSGDEVRAQSSKCPTFRSTETSTTMRFGGKSYEYTISNPQIQFPRPDDLTVEISPRQKKIKSGEKVTFTAGIENKIGTVSYEWDFGDGTTITTTGNTASHVFTGDDEAVNVVVTVRELSNNRTATDGASIEIGKVKKQKKPKKENPPADNNSTPNYTYGGGYGTGGGNGTGAGNSGTGSPSRPPEQSKEKEERQQPADSGLETVSGQLVDPSQIVQVDPSTTTTPASEGETAQPVDDSSDGWGGLSGGAMTAIGIGALLGLGGLAEAGAFAGMRRFRFRL